ncbi:GTP-binding protein GEM [Trichostrongylus colubriformis]|uniref:GTP-binding protein GEM n=1 Tax=Trichostrongylus colubriformis TaxID=6319 RepID=A0AAN8FZD4_TRICO
METNNNVAKNGLQNIERMEGQLRSFDYKNGSLVDNGYELKGLGKAIGRKRGENRRATCPEIYLYPEPSTPARQVLLRLYGGRNAGKKTLAHQIYHLASTTTPEQIHVISSETEEPISKTINFLLNGEEIQLEIVMESTLESSPFTDHVTMFVVVYSVDSRESFKKATHILYRIYQSRSSSFVPVVLVGNKIDLKRNIVISTLEGKSLAKIYKCSFVEVSALLSMNINTMWAELIKQLYVPSEYKPPDQSWMHKLLVRGRHLAKSCEELVQRIMA